MFEEIQRKFGVVMFACGQSNPALEEDFYQELHESSDAQTSLFEVELERKRGKLFVHEFETKIGECRFASLRDLSDTDLRECTKLLETIVNKYDGDEDDEDEYDGDEDDEDDEDSEE